jgi:ketosteroid isomerase-like protein
MQATAQSSESQAIKKVIIAFAKAGDNNDATTLGKYLDTNYRVVMNRLFGSTEVSVMPREVYLDKIKSKEFGGDDRKLKIEDINVNGTNASTKVTFKGSKMTFVSIILLVKDGNGQWKLISEVPMVS